MGARPRLLTLFFALLLVTALAVPTGAARPARAMTEPTAASGHHFRALVFSKTTGFRHDSIPAGIAGIEKLGRQNGFAVDATEDSAAFTDENLARYQVVIWLSATGDVLDETQQAAFQRYIEAGGGFVGIHAGGTDTECSPAGCPAGDGDWTWFRGLAGARFVGHPAVQQAQVVIEDGHNPSTRGLPGRWTRTDEWYDWAANPRPNVHVLAAVDEHTYSGGGMGADHPIAWCQKYDGGRAWYTSMGHTSESYSDPLFLRHILGGIRYAAGVEKADCSPQQPIADPLPAPVQSKLGLQVQQYTRLPQSSPEPPPSDQRLVRWARINYIGEVPDGSGRMYVPDLNGNMYLVENGTPHVYLDVKAQFPDLISSPGLGTGFGFVAFDPDFAHNGRFYTVHTEAGDALTTKTPDLPTPAKTVIHSVITQWTADDPSAATFHGTHKEILRLGFAGSAHDIQEISFNPTAKPGDTDYGTLYVAAGDGAAGANGNTPQELGIPQGKLLRIDPLGDNSASGRYGVPADNPFVGKAGILPEIYAIGFRDPHRFSWDPQTHKMYLGHMGEHTVESVDQILPGANYGWSVREGPFQRIRTDDCHVYPLPRDDRNYGYTYPVAAYWHNPPAGQSCNSDVGHAIIGGFLYRGRDVPALRGKYVFADNATGDLFYTDVREMQRPGHLATIHKLRLFDQDGQETTIKQLANADGLGDPDRVDIRFGIDSSGELLLLSKGNGKIWRITGTKVAG